MSVSEAIIENMAKGWKMNRREGGHPDPTPTPTPDPKPAPTPTPAEPKSWQEYFDAQPEPIKKLYTEHHTNLQNSIKTTRDERDGIKKQLEDLLPKAEKGSELEKKLTKAIEDLDTETKKSNFFESGVKSEIGCTNLSLAFMLAKTKNLWKSDGSPDWEAIKKEFPEGFTNPAAQANPTTPTTPLSPANPAGANSLTKESIEKMSPEEINKNWDAVQVFLKANSKK